METQLARLCLSYSLCPHPSLLASPLSVLYEGGMIAPCHICWHVAIKP